MFQDSRFQPLSTDAKTLYGILLDRMSLSARNGWLDKAGRVFIIYTVQEMCIRDSWMCMVTIWLESISRKSFKS